VPIGTRRRLRQLLGGVESNPGPAAAAAAPSSIVCGLLNDRSVVNKAAVIHDVIADNKLAVLALTETCVTSDAPDAIKLDIAPPDFHVLHQPRGSSTDKRGGGVAINHPPRRHQRPAVGRRHADGVRGAGGAVDSTTDGPRYRRLRLYRPPGAVTLLFCDQLVDILDQLVTAKQRFVVCGNFNFPGAATVSSTPTWMTCCTATT